MRYILHTDGASRGNPGPAACGVVLTDAHGKVIYKIGRTLGEMTNNEAEYRALLAGLDIALAYHAADLEIRLDSELLVAQLNGDYKIRAANLKPLYQQAKKKLGRLPHVRVVHVPRAENALADSLANQALDAK